MSLIQKGHGHLIWEIVLDGAGERELQIRLAERIISSPGRMLAPSLAKIGDVVFAVGSRYDNPAPADGVIFLAMNENPENNNQAGSLMTQIIAFSDD